MGFSSVLPTNLNTASGPGRGRLRRCREIPKLGAGDPAPEQNVGD